MRERWIYLPRPVRGDGPFAAVTAPAGWHRAVLEPFSAPAVRATDGELLGLDPGEFLWGDPAEGEIVIPARPIVVCLCGSTRFKDAFIDAQRRETLAGRIVLSVGLFGHEEAMDMDGPVKAMLDELHMRKIDMSDEVLILNFGGYIGESTRRELEYARSRGKRVRFLEPEGGTADARA